MPAIARKVTAAALQKALWQLKERNKTAAPVTTPITVLVPKRRFSDPRGKRLHPCAAARITSRSGLQGRWTSQSKDTATGTQIETVAGIWLQVQL